MIGVLVGGCGLVIWLALPSGSRTVVTSPPTAALTLMLGAFAGFLFGGYVVARRRSGRLGFSAGCLVCALWTGGLALGFKDGKIAWLAIPCLLALLLGVLVAGIVRNARSVRL